MRDMISLVEPLIPSLRRYARSLLRDVTAADDLVQDCLERVIRNWHGRRPDGDARTWTFTILHNLAINQMRQATRRGPHIAIEDAQEGVLAHPAAQDAGLRHRDIVAALDTLPEEQRSVLLLVSIEDLSYAEAARVLDIPIGTVMSRLARARDRLAAIMNDEAPAPAGRISGLRRVK